MQNDLCQDLRRKHKVERILAPMKQLITAFVAVDAPVFFVCFSLSADDEQFRRFGDRYCIEGTDGARVIPELIPFARNIVHKRKHSAFFETDLDARLRAKGVLDVYLTGLQTQICIMTTAADASFRGYHPVAVSDCVVSTRDEKRDQALDWIARYVGDVRKSDAVLGELMDDR